MSVTRVKTLKGAEVSMKMGNNTDLKVAVRTAENVGLFFSSECGRMRSLRWHWLLGTHRPRDRARCH